MTLCFDFLFQYSRTRLFISLIRFYSFLHAQLNNYGYIFYVFFMVITQIIYVITASVFKK